MNPTVLKHLGLIRDNIAAILVIRQAQETDARAACASGIESKELLKRMAKTLETRIRLSNAEIDLENYATENP